MVVGRLSVAMTNVSVILSRPQFSKAHQEERKRGPVPQQVAAVGSNTKWMTLQSNLWVPFVICYQIVISFSASTSSIRET